MESRHNINEPPDLFEGLAETGNEHEVTEEWAEVCLALAEAQDWPTVRLKSGWTIDGGAHLWRIFCGKANLTRLRDLAYPALKEMRNKTLPEEVPEMGFKGDSNVRTRSHLVRMAQLMGARVVTEKGVPSEALPCGCRIACAQHSKQIRKANGGIRWE